MYRLDPVGRFAPSSLDVSRAAATRHAHLSAVDRPATRRTATHRSAPCPPRGSGWRALAIRLVPRQG